MLLVPRFIMAIDNTYTGFFFKFTIYESEEFDIKP